MNVTWDCPTCQNQNTSEYWGLGDTICESCDGFFLWEDIFDDDKLDELNEKVIKEAGIEDNAVELVARTLRLSVIQDAYDQGYLEEKDALELLAGPLTPGDDSTVVDDSDRLKVKE